MKRKFLSVAVATTLLAPACAALAYPGDAFDEAAAAVDSGGGTAADAREKAREAREKAREEREKARDATRERGDIWRRWAEDYARDIRGSMGTAFAGHLGARTVKGAPYSAEVVTEVNQSLADGNVISRRTQGAVYRDGEGRTRQESAGEGKARTVIIQDPVEGKSAVLAPGAKHPVMSAFPKGVRTYAVNARDRQVVRVDDTEVRIEDGKVFVNGVETPASSVHMNSRRGNDVRIENGRILVNGKPLQGTTRGGSDGVPGSEELHGHGNVVVRTIETRDGGDGTQREEVRVQVIRGNEFPPLPPMPPMPPMPAVPPMPPMPSMPPMPPTAKFSLPSMPPLPPIPGIQSMRFESTAHLGKGVTANLGTRDFDGVKAEGKSTTWTIPAGEIGNRKPIEVVSESWYSPDLQVTVYSRYNDPRTGETVYRLSNLRRGEPSPELFKVPEEAAAKPGEKERRAK